MVVVSILSSTTPKKMKQKQRQTTLDKPYFVKFLFPFPAEKNE